MSMSGSDDENKNHMDEMFEFIDSGILCSVQPRF